MPPAGVLHDEAFLNGHLVLVFFFLVVVAGLMAAIYYLYKNDSRYFKTSAYFAIAGMVIGLEGLIVYWTLLSWVVEAIGIWLMFIALVLAAVPLFEKRSNPEAQPH